MTRSRETGDVGYRAYKKNYLINGGFDVWQRGDIVNGTSSKYTSDRWRLQSSAEPWTVDRITNYVTVNSLKITGTTAAVSGFRNFYQIVENGSALMAGKQMTLSCRIRASTPLTAFFFVADTSTGDDVGSPRQSDISITTVWQTFSWTTAAFDSTPSSTEVNKRVGLGNLAQLANAQWIEIEWFQLEEGTSATEFEYVSPQQNLAECQRYFERIVVLGNNIATIGQAVSTSAAISNLNYTVKRVNPTVTFSSGFVTTTAAGAAAGGTTGADITGLTSARISVIGAAGLVGGNATCLVHPTSGFIDVDAEL